MPGTAGSLTAARSAVAMLDTHTMLSTLQGREHGIRLSSHMERYGDKFTLVIANADKYEDRWVGGH